MTESPGFERKRRLVTHRPPVCWRLHGFWWKIVGSEWDIYVFPFVSKLVCNQERGRLSVTDIFPKVPLGGDAVGARRDKQMYSCFVPGACKGSENMENLQKFRLLLCNKRPAEQGVWMHAHTHRSWPPHPDWSAWRGCAVKATSAIRRIPTASCHNQSWARGLCAWPHWFTQFWTRSEIQQFYFFI